MKKILRSLLFPRGYVTVFQAVHLSKKSPTTIRTWADSGRIRALRDPAGRRLLLRKDLERILGQGIDVR